jgi:uncharacterized protein (TIGR02466 family)
MSFDPLKPYPFIKRLFATPIYTDMCSRDNFEIIQTEFQKTYNTLIKKDWFKQNPTWGSNTHMLSRLDDADYAVSFNDSIIHKFDHKIFAREVEAHCRKYLSACGYRHAEYVKMHWRGSWMTLNKKGMYAHTHDHGDSDIAGVYYVNTNGEDGDFQFFSNLKELKSAQGFLEYEQHWQFKPQVGRFILFPGYLDHAVMENRTDNNRVSVSFNISLIPDYEVPKFKT